MTKLTPVQSIELKRGINSVKPLMGELANQLEPGSKNADDFRIDENTDIVPTYFFYHRRYTKIEPNKPKVQIGFVRATK